MRAQDRHHLKGFFAEQGYTPHTPPNRPRLLMDLEHWINKPGSPASNPLQELWGKDEQHRNAIADIVEQEIRAWDGPSEEEHSRDSVARKETRLAAQLQPRGLRKEPALLLIVPEPRTASPSNSYLLRFERDASDVAQDLEDERVRMERLSLPEYYSLELEGALSIEQALQSGLRLHQSQLGWIVERSPREAVPLRWDEATGLYIECSRLEEAGHYFLVCRDELTGETQRFLSSICSEAPLRMDGPCGDVPAGWTLFARVVPEHVKPPSDLDSPELANLLPASQKPGDEPLFRVSGGIYLRDRNTWHVISPPEIGIVPLDVPNKRLKLILRAEWQADAQDRESVLADSQGVIHLRPEQLREVLAVGDYRLELFQIGEDGMEQRVSRRKVHIRSGSYPRALGQRSAFPLVRPLSPSTGSDQLISVNLDRRQPDAPVATGARILEPTGIALGRHPGSAGSLGTPSESLVSRVSAANSPIGEPLGEYDLLLDSLTYARSGSWASLHKIAEDIRKQQGIARPDFPNVAAERLSSLGHIEIGYDISRMRPRYWCIAPATIVVHPWGEAAFLSGLRNELLVKALEGAINELEGQLDRVLPHLGPAVLRIRGLSVDDLELAASVASDECGIDIGVQSGVQEYLADSALSLEGVIESLPPVELTDNTRLEFFDTRSDLWCCAPSRPLSGAYLVKGTPMVHCFATDKDIRDGRLRACHREWCKLLAHALAGEDVVKFDSSQGILRSLHGHALPGLLERALVLCNGELPRREGTQLVYRGVPDRVGNIIEQAASIDAKGVA